MKTYLHAAAYVTGNDQLIGSQEGLECLILEIVYYINAGNLRRAWLVLRRAIARNDNALKSRDYEVTKAIGQMLQKAAQSMPANWWLIPSTRMRNQAAAPENDDKLKGVLRILLQITHFNLLILRHLQYMLRLTGGKQVEYGKVPCVNSSRELSGRYIKFRCTNRIAFNCRSIDFSAFTASLGLLLAHTERWNRSADGADFLVPQRLINRALVDEIIDLMMEVDSSSSDSQLEQTASILKALSSIEADAATRIEEPAASIAEIQQTPSDLQVRCLQLKIPTFITFRITRNGVSLATESELFAGIDQVAVSRDPRPSFSGQRADPCGHTQSQPQKALIEPLFRPQYEHPKDLHQHDFGGNLAQT
ncbi:hypothetical protein ColTof3_11406 [Colletotrichum tofieldiae]|nr:hypothetical protein ColTof3_11406 [Colletotrichum tofieldiae]